MGVINFAEGRCQNCYACVRVCPVQAIKIKKEQAIILDARCIGCGLCLKACPQNLKEIESELEKVKRFIKTDQKVAVSLAPTYVSLFDDEATKLGTALKQLGFDYIEETVVGAKAVTQQYEMYYHQMIDSCYITSCCPTVNLLIQKHYPQTLPYLLPVISPMSCHARLLKERYGQKTFVVFIGPCLSKKVEAASEQAVDAVLTFEELKQWLNEEKIELHELDETPLEECGSEHLHYPIRGGITKGFHKKAERIDIISVDGISDCIAAIEGIDAGQFNNTLFEMSACRHSCVGGPAIGCEKSTVFERQLKIRKHANKIEAINHPAIKNKDHKISVYKYFSPLYAEMLMPSESDIERILNHIGKYKKEDELNCGSCGYKTCREKAIAVYNKMAEPSMCLPYMKQKAETYSHVLFDVTPSMIIVVNESLEIIDFNPAAEAFFEIKKDKAIGLPINAILDSERFETVISEKQSVLGERIELNNQMTTLIQSIMYLEQQDVMMCILNDISKQLLQQQKMQHLKINAIHMAQEVINKQMVVAQEIASLLGETTAETKVTLTRLKNLIEENEVES
ncbi:MAG TPA: 4Fe-4S ferredoxin [Firmicutes bacterium]|nr:4Fe-4S ferredoxin [Bacillota bacterium]